MANIYQYCIDYFNDAPIIIQLSWVLSALFAVTLVSLIFYLKFLRSTLRTKERIQNVYLKKYESDLIEYLYSGNEDEEMTKEQGIIVNYLHKCAQNRLKRKLIITTLLKLRNEVSGETADAIKRLYYQTGLIDYGTLKLRSKKWEIVARGIKELAQFDVTEVHYNVIAQINHPKKEVRREVQMYLVKLFHFKGLDFLDLLKSQLSEWDQIQLLEILQNFDDQNLPSITKWLRSKNTSVVLFALKIAKIYNQYDSKDEIIKLLEHPDLNVRIDAIAVLSDLGVFEVVDLLKNNLNEKDIDEQIAFFKMMENMYTPSDVDFLFEYMNHENFDIKVSVNKIFKEMNIQDASKFQINTAPESPSSSTNLIQAS